MASAASLWKSLRSMRYGWSNGGAERFCSQARHWAIHPANSGAIPMASTTSANCRTKADSSHRTNTSREAESESCRADRWTVGRPAGH